MEQKEIIKRHSKSIEITFTNGTTKDICFRVTMPYKADRDLGIFKIYKKLKPAVANAEQVPFWQIWAKHKIIDSELIGRVLYEFRGGVSLNMPDDANVFDYKIVLAQLEVLKMSCSD